MSLLNKFASVEIKADNRISEEDKAFCLRHQEAFDKSGPALLVIAEQMDAALKEQESIFGNDEDSSAGRYVSCDEFRCNADFVYGAMKQRNKTFISVSVNYFSHKYKVELNREEIVEHLIPTPPKEPSLPWGGYREMTDEQIDQFKERMDVYHQEEMKYSEAMRTLPLRYEQIVDEIFVQLGGFSFQEQAMNEFLERTWNCCHQSWGEHKETFEIKNDTLRLTNGWCYCDDRWSWGPEWKPSDNLKTLLDALAWYQCGRMGEAALWFPELCRYNTKENEFNTYNMSKVKAIKLFKNGRVDIKFRSAAYVQEFVEQCMRRRAA